jgi:hypothetical protein
MNASRGRRPRERVGVGHIGLHQHAVLAEHNTQRVGVGVRGHGNGLPEDESRAVNKRHACVLIGEARDYLCATMGAQAYSERDNQQKFLHGFLKNAIQMLPMNTMMQANNVSMARSVSSSALIER